jgi:hypothetical protein
MSKMVKIQSEVEGEEAFQYSSPLFLRLLLSSSDVSANSKDDNHATEYAVAMVRLKSEQQPDPDSDPDPIGFRVILCSALYSKSPRQSATEEEEESDGHDVYTMTQVEGSKSFTHLYQFDPSLFLSFDEKMASNHQIMLVPLPRSGVQEDSHPTDTVTSAATREVILWTWDPPKLYKLKVCPSQGVSLLAQKALSFRPVYKANFGLEAYFSRDGEFLTLVSTCPWIHYEISVKTLLYTRRSREFMRPFNEISFQSYCKGMVCQGDQEGSLVEYEGRLIDKVGQIQKVDGSVVCFRLSVQQPYKLLHLIHDKFNLYAIFSDKFSNNSNQQIVSFKVKDFWSFTGLSKFKSRPRSNVLIEMASNGSFVADDLAFDIHSPRKSEVADIFLDVSTLRKRFPFREIDLPYSSHSMSTIYIASKQYLFIDLSLILDPVTLNPLRVLNMSYICGKWPHSLTVSCIMALSHEGLFSDWFHPLLSNDSLENTPLKYPMMPSDHEVFASLDFSSSDSTQLYSHPRDHALHTDRAHFKSKSPLSVLGVDILIRILDTYLVDFMDVVRFVHALPSLKPWAFREISPSRAYLRAQFLYHALNATLDKDKERKKLANRNANSVLLYLCSLRDDESLRMLASSCWFKSRGEIRRDERLARQYVRAIPPHRRPDPVILRNGKDSVRLNFLN